MNLNCNAIVNFFDLNSKIPQKEILDNVDQLIGDIRNEEPKSRQKLIESLADEILNALPNNSDDFANFVGRQLSDASGSKKTFYHTLAELISLMLLEKARSKGGSDSLSPAVRKAFIDLKCVINKSWQNRKTPPFVYEQIVDVHNLILSNLAFEQLTQFKSVSKAINKIVKSILIERINNGTIAPFVMTFKKAKIFFSGYENQVKRLHLERETPKSDELAKVFPHLTHLTYGKEMGALSYDPDFSFLAHLGQLKCLELHDEGKLKIDDKALGHLASLTNLESLSLIKCKSSLFSNQGLKDLAHLKALKTLTIEDGNDGESMSDKSLSFFPQMQLENLNLTSKTITNETFKCLDNMKNIINLRLNCSEIKDDDLYFLKQMPHLKTLNLSYCSNITDKCLEYFKDLKQLEKLDLCFCPDITGEGFEYFSALNQLKTINLRGSSARADRNYFNDVGLSFLESKINMEKLDLTGCHLITDKGLNYLARMYGLKILNLSEMEKITTQGLENMFKEMKHIQSLSIKDCSNVKSFKFLSKMPQLKFLVLSGPISGNIAFEGLENLEELDLAYTDVTDKDLESLNELKKLKILYLGKNVTEAFVKNLKKSLSNTFISLTCEAF